MNIFQLFAVSTANTTGPWKISSLRTQYKIQGPLSLRLLVNKVQLATNILWVQVRDPSILLSAKTPPELASQWNTTAPSKSTLVQLSQTLASVGAAMVFVSSDWRTVGIRGTFGSLAALGSLRVEFRVAQAAGLHPLTPEGGWGLVGAGGVALFSGTAVAGAFMVLPAVSAAATDIGGVLMLGSAGALIAIGVGLTAYGIYDLATSDTSQNVPDNVDAGVPAQIGQTPNGVDPNNLPDTAIDAGTLPDAPPSSAPPSCPPPSCPPPSCPPPSCPPPSCPGSP
jgi:hypothetical protein